VTRQGVWRRSSTSWSRGWSRGGTTPHDVVYEEDGLKLLRYRNGSGVAFREPILICYALINRPYILDLQPERSVVQQLLKRGFDVYLIDWGVPSAADRTMRLHDYVCVLMKHAAEYVRKASASPTFNLLGYCMGGTMSTMFTALYPEMVRTLTLMAAPIDFAGGSCSSRGCQRASSPRCCDSRKKRECRDHCREVGPPGSATRRGAEN
jgi:class III poly(R)-hydroxyalkanoic acid synthase PhaC subunit